MAKIEEIAREKGVTPSQLALAWVLHRGDDIVPIPGTKHVRYLEENVARARRRAERGRPAQDRRGRAEGRRRGRSLSGHEHGQPLSVSARRGRDQLVGPQAGGVVEDLRHDHQLVGAGAGDERVEALPAPSSGVPDERAGQRLVEDRALHRAEAALVVRRPAAAAGPAGRVRRFTNACCTDVISRRASASVSAANTLTPSITYGRASCSEGRKSER